MDQLARLTTLLNATNAFGSTLSRELAGMTADLHVTSRQQATNFQEQVAAVTEVTTSLEELNETANQIASSAAAAADSANQTVEIATTVRNASEQARSTSQEGNEAVDQAVASVERVRNRIELLGQRLLHLTEQTRKVGTIIDIIDEIADETHLLALNASIEAAGSIHTQGGENYRSVRGDRFGVIAQEVKNLADRSRESTEEVRQAITEMQGAVAAAVLVAEEGKKETSAALSRSQIAGSVITKLNEIIYNSATQAEEILSAVEEVNIRCDEISIATGQQRSANQQILFTMRTVAQVSQESAGAVSVLSDTVSMVNRQVDQLNATLDKTNQSLRLVTT
jgi:methyl-accepting chemotaxis protein